MPDVNQLMETYNNQDISNHTTCQYSEVCYAEGNPGTPTGYYSESLNYTVTYDAEHGRDE